MKRRKCRGIVAAALLVAHGVAQGTAGAQECIRTADPIDLPLVPPSSPEMAPPLGPYRVGIFIPDGAAADRPAGSDGKGVWLDVEVDTGSTGIVIPSTAVPANIWKASNKFGQIFYSSDNAYHPGKFVSIPLELGRRPDGTAAAAISQIEVLAAQCTCDVVDSPEAGSADVSPRDRCEDYNGTLVPDRKYKAVQCLEISSGFGMMGVGYDRGVQTARNPFLRLKQMDDGTMAPGYIIGADKIALGISPKALDRFVMTKLEKPAPSAGQTNPPDWVAPSACVTVGQAEAKYQVCGALLPDTGLSYMMLTRTGTEGALPSSLMQPRPLPPHKTSWGTVIPQEVPPGIPVLVEVGPEGKPILVYGFTTPPVGAAPVASGTQAAPATVQWRGTAPVPVATTAPLPVSRLGHINTGRLIITAADYAYDAGCGRAGFRQR